MNPQNVHQRVNRAQNYIAPAFCPMEREFRSRFDGLGCPVHAGTRVDSCGDHFEILPLLTSAWRTFCSPPNSDVHHGVPYFDVQPT